MKKLLLILIFLSFVFTSFSQTTDNIKNDTIIESISTLKDKVDGVQERLTTAENDLYKLTKLKISGYIQAQYQYFDNPSIYPNNYFSVRRARVKFVYEPINGINFVLQPDFSPGSIDIKDAYVQLNDPWIKTFSLYAGKFNRPNYEVEYSSSSREVPERSMVIRSLYPGERTIGAKLEIRPPKTNLKVQMAIFNGNDGLTILDANGVNINPVNKDFDNYKDFMGRITYGFRLGNFGVLDLGVHGYYGNIKATTTEVLNGNYELIKTVNIGDKLTKKWVGAEFQLYMDLLGGTTLKGEVLYGQNAFPGYIGNTTSLSSITSAKNDTLFINNITTNTSNIRPNQIKNFFGYYVYLTKNIGKRNQVAVRYDYYDPNIDIKAGDIALTNYNNNSTKTDNKITTTGNFVTTNTTKTVVNDKYTSGTSDVKYGTWTFAYSYFFTENIKVMLAYEMPTNSKSENLQTKYTVNGVSNTLDYGTVFPQNTLTVRLQVKF